MVDSSPQAPSTRHEPRDGAERRALLGDDGVDDWQITKSPWYLVVLALGIGGLQIAWSVELSNGSPYLLSLGLSKSLMALAWMAGPLTGTLVVPYVGMLSDRCRVSWGRRRPFLLGGTAATMAGLLFLAWTQEIVAAAFVLLGLDAAGQGCRTAVIIVAVVAIYVLDIAINTVQASTRALMVDCAPAHQQEQVNAMASRLTGVGNIIGFVAGYAHLTHHLWFLGNSQFKILCAIASIALGVSVAISASVVKERDPRAAAEPRTKTPHLFAFFFTIFKSVRRLPPRTKRVCQTQFCAWVGFFPLLFYTSSYIGEMYVQPYLRANPNMTKPEIDKLYEQATRIGTFALLANAIVSLATNLFLPVFISPTFDKVAHEHHEGSVLDKLRIPGFTIKRAWHLSLLLFAAVMFCTPFVPSVQAATVLVALAGVTWAMTLWAPWAIISAEISQRDALDRANSLAHDQQASSTGLDAHDVDAHGVDAHDVQGFDEEQADQAGVILGIHNMAIALPQMVATVGSSLIFKIWQKPRGTPGDHSIAIVMAVGGACVLVASVFAARIKDEAEDDSKDTERG